MFSIAPVFRAENSNTPRHMTEFTGLDLEMEIRDSYTEVLSMLEGVLLFIFRGIQGQFHPRSISKIRQATSLCTCSNQICCQYRAMCGRN